jgi:hypothetical protein
MLLINNGALMNTRGMVTLENAVLIIVVALGLLAMQAYLRRSVQAHWRTNADSISDEQYDVNGRTTENFINTHPRISGQPQITLKLNSNPSISGDYSSDTHIGAFRRGESSLEGSRSMVLVSNPAGVSTDTAIFTVKNWQPDCSGGSEEGCGDDDED